MLIEKNRQIDKVFVKKCNKRTKSLNLSVAHYYLNCVETLTQCYR